MASDMATGANEASTSFSAESFFETQEPPAKLAHMLDGVRSFVAGHAREGRRVVLVTVSVAPDHLGIS
jgi:phosphopantothenate-cysteine ligase